MPQNKISLTSTIAASALTRRDTPVYLTLQTTRLYSSTFYNMQINWTLLCLLQGVYLSVQDSPVTFGFVSPPARPYAENNMTVSMPDFSQNVRLAISSTYDMEWVTSEGDYIIQLAQLNLGSGALSWVNSMPVYGQFVLSSPPSLLLSCSLHQPWSVQARLT